jgi:HlyD family secretion protein
MTSDELTGSFKFAIHNLRLIMKFRGKHLLISSILLINASCSYLAGISGLKKSLTNIPTARATRGPVEVQIHALGDLRPARTTSIVAPPVSGGMMQIIHLVKTGMRVKQGEVVIQFDPSEQEYNLEQSKSQLEEAEQQIIKVKADQAVRGAKNKVDLMKAQYNVRRAELKVQGNELLSAIEAKKNLIDLEDAKRRYEQLQRDIQSRASSDAADLAVQNVARMKAEMGMKLAQQNIENMIWKTPVDGVVVLAQNLDSLGSGGRINSISEIPEFREGDQAYPGRMIGMIQDTNELEISSKVLETDRANLDVGQPVDIWMDSTPLKTYSGRIKSMATTATDAASANNTTDLLEALSTRSFDAIFEVDGKGDNFFMGVSVRMIIKGNAMKNALSIPRQAVFQKNSKPVVYVRRGEEWESREIRIKYLTESRAVLDGLDENTEVAMVNPDLQKSKTAGQKGALASILGGSAQ